MSYSGKKEITLIYEIVLVIFNRICQNFHNILVFVEMVLDEVVALSRSKSSVKQTVYVGVVLLNGVGIG